MKPRLRRDIVVRNARKLVEWTGSKEELHPTLEGEIDQIHGEKLLKRGKEKEAQFLVHFKGFSSDHDQWVWKSDLHADELLEKWNKHSEGRNFGETHSSDAEAKGCCG